MLAAPRGRVANPRGACLLFKELGHLCGAGGLHLGQGAIGDRVPWLAGAQERLLVLAPPAVAFAASFLKEAGPGARPLVVGGVGGGLQAELLEGADDVGLDVGARLGAHHVRDGVGFIRTTPSSSPWGRRERS